MINIGEMNHLTVKRKSDLGYMITDGIEEILLHYKEANKELELNEEIDVYVYTDKENRKTATMSNPKLLINKADFVTVVNKIEGVGVFIDNNTPKDIFISKDYLPYDLEKWPNIGDLLYCELKIKKNSLTAKPVNRFDITAKYKNVKYAEKEQVKARVLRIADKGIGLISYDLVYIFVPISQFRGKYRLGEEVEVSITKMLDVEAYGSLNEHKEILMDTDKEIILSYLKEHNNTMPLTAKSSSEDVEKYFQMSRKAFKRAYGSLYKDHLIDFDENNTYLRKL